MGWNNGCPKKVREKISNTIKEKKLGFQKGYTPWNKGKTGVRCGVPKGRKNPQASKFMKKYMRENHPFRGKTKKDYPNLANAGRKKGCIAWNKGIPQRRKTREKLSKIGIEQWKDSEYRESQIKKILKGLIKRPTSLEQQMIDIIKKHNLPYRYTGNGSFIIGGKNPDFVNVNGEKICIEVANLYHHAEDYPQKRKTHFKKWGWDCIVFRTDDLNEEHILKEIR